MSVPLVSVISPSWHRSELLQRRCMQGVQDQTYPNIEHLVISDGPDPVLRKLFSDDSQLTTDCQDMRRGRKFPVWFYELPEHDPAPHWGHHARLYGIEAAAGDLIAYCDDDDSLRPEHVARLVAALEADPAAGWACSVMASHGPNGTTEIGYGPPSLGNIGTPMILHRRETLQHGTWGPAGDFEDWDLCNRWIHAGIGYVKVDEVTVDVWPSLYYGGRVP